MGPATLGAQRRHRGYEALRHVAKRRAFNAATSSEPPCRDRTDDTLEADRRVPGLSARRGARGHPST